jgi:hypothetical protein
VFQFGVGGAIKYNSEWWNNNAIRFQSVLYQVAMLTLLRRYKLVLLE